MTKIITHNRYREAVPYGFYMVLIIVLYFSMITSVFMEALDISRYYEAAEIAVCKYSSIQYLDFLFKTNVDFIYSMSLFFAQKNGLSLNIVTTFYLSLYYICCCELIRTEFGLKKIPNIILLYILLCAPFIWVQSISRNLAAIAFYYLAIIFFRKDRAKVGAFFMIVSVLTHFSMIVYVLVGFAAFGLGRKLVSLNNNKMRILFFVSIILAIIFPNVLVLIMRLIASTLSLRYFLYADVVSSSIWSIKSIGYGDKIPIACVWIYSICLILMNKRYNFYYWGLFILVVMLSFSIFSSLMLTNRIIMIMPLFVAANVCDILKAFPQKIMMISMLSIVGMICVILNFYSYRTAFAL